MQQLANESCNLNDDRFNEGLSLLRKKKWSKAKVTLEVLLDQKYYYEYRVQFYYGFALKQLNHFNKAYESIQSALKQNNQLYEQLIQDSEIMLNKNQKDVLALVVKGIALTEKNYKVEANQFFDLALKIDSKYTFALVLKSINLWQISELQKTNETQEQFETLEEIRAFELIDKALKIVPTYSMAYLNRGVFLCKRKYYQQGIEQFDIAIEIDKSFSDAYFNKGLALISLQQFEQAIWCFEQVIKISPNKEAYLNQGDCQIELFQFEEASKCFEIAINYDKNDKNVYFCLAQCLQRQELYKLALNQKVDGEEILNDQNLQNIKTLYEKALEIDKKLIEAQKNIGVLLDTHGQRIEALKSFQEAYLLDHNDKDTISFVGQQLGKLQCQREAIQCYRIAQSYSADANEFNNHIKKLQQNR